MLKLSYIKRSKKMQQKEISKAEMRKKVEAYKTMYQVMVKTNAEFMVSLTRILNEKTEQLKQLEEKLGLDNASEKDNAEYLFIGGYIQCLKDILYARNSQE